MPLRLLVILCVFSLIFTGCVHRYGNDTRDVAAIIDCRLEKEVEWNQFCYKDSYLQDIIDKMSCNRELTVEEATQIALLNNPAIQAIFEELGIAQAELIEAGLLSNPVFDGYVRLPHQSGASVNTQFSVVMNFIDLFLIPLRIKVAELVLQQTKVHVANAILNVAFEVQRTFYQLQAEQEKQCVLNQMLEIATIEADIFAKQTQVGNIYALDQEINLLDLFEIQLAIETAQTNIISLRERLNRLMGFCEDRCWIVGSLNNVCFCNNSCECLEDIAYSQRLDLEEARWEVFKIASTLGLRTWWTWTNGKLGISTEKDPEGFRATGPVFSAEIPIFNFGQGARAKIYAQLRQAQDRLEELEIKVLSEVREAYQLISAYGHILNSYTNNILPTQEKILDSTERLYNVMGKGIFYMLERKKEQLGSYIDYRMAIKDYWVAYVQLEKALGGKLLYHQREYE